MVMGRAMEAMALASVMEERALGLAMEVMVLVLVGLV
jgi:hypothetical protein